MAFYRYNEEMRSPMNSKDIAVIKPGGQSKRSAGRSILAGKFIYESIQEITEHRRSILSYCYFSEKEV